MLTNYIEQMSTHIEIKTESRCYDIDTLAAEQSSDFFSAWINCRIFFDDTTLPILKVIWDKCNERDYEFLQDIVKKIVPDKTMSYDRRTFYQSLVDFITMFLEMYNTKCPEPKSGVIWTKEGVRYIPK